jgi:hypothetical protein
LLRRVIGQWAETNGKIAHQGARGVPRCSQLADEGQQVVVVLDRDVGPEQRHAQFVPLFSHPQRAREVSVTSVLRSRKVQLFEDVKLKLHRQTVE